MNNNNTHETTILAVILLIAVIVVGWLTYSKLATMTKSNQKSIAESVQLRAAVKL